MIVWYYLKAFGVVVSRVVAPEVRTHHLLLLSWQVFNHSLFVLPVIFALADIDWSFHDLPFVSV